jgi:hypothetical protein
MLDLPMQSRGSNLSLLMGLARLPGEGQDRTARHPQATAPPAHCSSKAASCLAPPPGSRVGQLAAPLCPSMASQQQLAALSDPSRGEKSQPPG